MNPQDLTQRHRDLLGRAYWADAIWLGKTTDIDSSRFDDDDKRVLSELVAAGYLRPDPHVPDPGGCGSQYLVATPGGVKAFHEACRLYAERAMADLRARRARV